MKGAGHGAQQRGDLRLKGAGLKAQFVISMSVALTLILSVSAFLIYVAADRIATRAWTKNIEQAVRLSQENPPEDWQFSGLKPRDPARLGHNGVQLNDYSHKGRTGVLYTYPSRVHIDPKDRVAGVSEREAEDPYFLLLPTDSGGLSKLAGLLFAITALVIVVGAGMAYWAARRVSRPVNQIIEDVRQIAKGNLQHKTRSQGGGEIELLARAINRMTRDLESAREADRELSMRQREREVAGGVREALLPLATPLVEGYDLGAAWIGSADFGGDFHDFIERDDGRVGLLVCDVSGTGIPGALIGATARSYLRSELERSDDVVASFQRVNRWLVNDMHRGTFVSALYALIDPVEGRASVVCAGHKIPLLRYDSGVRELRVVHPEGIALGFDKGSIFDRKLQLVETPIEPGDRLLLTNSAPLGLLDAKGAELGEMPFYARVKKHSPLDTSRFLKTLKRDLERYTGSAGFNRDVSIVTIQREA